MEYTILDVETNESFNCREDEPLLSAMKRTHKGPIPYGCGGGGCGVCKIHVLNGDFICFKKMSRAHISSEEYADHIVLSCCIKPTSNLIIKKFSQD